MNWKCFICRSDMEEKTITSTSIGGIKYFECPKCGDRIYGAEMVHMLQEAVKALRVTYRQDDEDNNVWVCSWCDLTWQLFSGNPKENNMNFCPQCGRPISD